MIDTPGDGNFFTDTQNSLAAVDACLLVIDAVAGAQVQTQKIMAFAQELALPCIIFINKLDSERADFFRIVDQIPKALGVKPLVLQVPIGKEASFQGVVNLTQMRALIFKDDLSGAYEETEIPEDVKATCGELTSKMTEDIAESDDTLLERYLEGEDISPEGLLAGLKKGILSRKLVPVLCGAASKNIGARTLLDFIVNCFPSPEDRGAVKGTNPKTQADEERAPSASEPFSAFVFKTIADPYAGKLTVFRVYSGTLTSDTVTLNAPKGVKERIGQVFQMEGKQQRALSPAVAGDIVAVAKLKETTTGDTLCAEKSPIIIQGFTFPSPVISYAIVPKSKGDEDKMTSSIARLTEEDPTLKVGRDEQTKEFILSGMGQVHLEVAVEKLKRKFGVEVKLLEPKVPYKETIKKAANGVIYRHKKQTGGRGQFAEVHFDITPLEHGTGFQFEVALTGMNVPRGFVPAVQKGIVETMDTGVLAGFPAVDFKVRFYDGKSHEVDSSEIAFKIAASMALKKGLQEASPVLLEPIMTVEVAVPDDCMGDVIGDLNSRRGRVLGVDTKGTSQVIRAQVPMAEILRYASDLTSMTSARGDFTMDFSHYEEVPAHLTEKIVAATKRGREKEQ
jgi:elongation factor G